MIVSARAQTISRTILKFPSITHFFFSTTRATFFLNISLSSICQFLLQKSVSNSMWGMWSIFESFRARVVLPEQLVPIIAIRLFLIILTPLKT